MTPTEMIDQLVADGIVDLMVQRVKTGKEAEVFIVRKGEEYFAAKVYKDRNDRSFHNNADYREGRSVRNTRDMRAMAKGSRHGVAMAEADWRSNEHQALTIAHAAGLRVPKPDILYEDVLLMELVLGSDGQPAPRLIDVPLTRDQAVAYHRDVVGQIIGLLACDLIHGDLSPYNILLAWNGPTVIDLPQVIKAAHNSQSEKFLLRDVRNVTDHFARYAPELKKRLSDGYAIWKKYMRREMAPDYFPDENESAAAVQHELKLSQPRPPPPLRQQQRPQQNAHPHPNGARPSQQQHGARPQHPNGPRPPQKHPPQPHPNGPRPAGSHPQHANGARPPQKPQHPHRNGASHPPKPQGPVIERVNKLPGNAPAQGQSRFHSRPRHGRS